MALDPREPLLIVRCTVESTTTELDGWGRVEEETPQQRAVRIPRVPAGYDDCGRMAEELVVRFGERGVRVLCVHVSSNRKQPIHPA